MKYWLVLLSWILVPLSLKSQDIRKGKDRALFFAVNDYQKLSNLKNPIRHAKEIARELEQKYDFITEVVSNPSNAKIEKKIKAYKRDYQNGNYPHDGQLLIFFSGHGIKYGDNGYFMPSDANPKRPHATAIEYDYWRTEIDEIQCQHILVVIDACYSISFDPDWNNRTDRKFSRPGEKDFDKILDRHNRYKARIFFTSDASGDETPDRSTFARRFIEGLRVYYSDSGYLKSSILFSNYLEKAAPIPGGGSFGQDEPGACFLFFQKNKDKEKEAALVVEKKKLEADMIFVKGGTFKAKGSIGKNNEDTLSLTSVQVEDFYINRYEVTVKEFSQFIDATKFQTSADRDGGSFFWVNEQWEKQAGINWEFDANRKKRANSTFDHPVLHVSWYDAIAYCNWLSEKFGYQKVYTVNGKNVVADWEADGYRLPMEIEWEYAARGGGKDDSFAGTSIRDSLYFYANFCDSACDFDWKIRDQDDGYSFTAPVKSFDPNKLGLYDMSGNALEWCWDQIPSKMSNEIGKKTEEENSPETSSLRVSRGGSWSNGLAHCQVNHQHLWEPTFRYHSLGFRIARSGRF